MAGERAKKLIGNIYSGAAEKLYEPFVVNGAFRVFGGNLNALVLEQGRKAIEAAGDGAILDMPVGTGYFALEMAERHSGVVIGTDLAHGMVVRSRTMALQRGIRNLALVEADAHRLPFPPDSFEVVVSSNGLQVIPGLDPATTELVRVLKPGGHIFVSVLTLPLGAALPHAWREHLPVMLSSGREVADVLQSKGIAITHFARERLATLIEGVKR